MVFKLTVFILLGVFGTLVLNTLFVFEPEIARDFALEQMTNSDSAVQQERWYELAKNQLSLLLGLGYCLLGICLFYHDIKDFVRKIK